MKKFIYLFAFIAFAANDLNAQSCNLVISPMDTVVCPGDTVCIQSWASITVSPQSFDFNTGTLPPGWSTAGGTQFTSPCGPSPSGTPYYWASTTSGTPQMQTAAYDVSCGGNLVWDMIFSVQGGAAPCEGPDQYNEGVELQYSAMGGPWTSIIYYVPNGTTLLSTPTSTTPGVSGPTPMTSWATYNVPIPIGAMTTSTAFRWIQFNSSGTCCDNWGIEDVFVNGGPCNTATVNWSNGLVNTNNFCAPITSDSIFIAYVYDTLGVLQCQDTATVSLYTNTLTYNLADDTTLLCPDLDAPIQITNIQGALPPLTFTWSGPNAYSSTTNPTTLPGSSSEQDSEWYYVTIMDGCGFSHLDSINVITNKILNIDSLVAIPASSCSPEGQLMGYASGLTNNGTQPIYVWFDSLGNPHGGQSWANVSPGWYTMIVSDDVCSDTAQVYVDAIPPPVADFSVNNAEGCDPVTVTFYNESVNGNTYDWDFGSGTVTVNNMDNQTINFNTTTIVTLIAYDAFGCASPTVDGLIEVYTCGCTDIEAVNYNAGAQVDDGSCFYPEPTVVAPNIFSPNGDGVNDYFELTVKNANKIEMLITNRWGNVMMEKSYDLTDPAVLLLPLGWDGTAPNGAPANQGTYFLTYVVTGVDNEATVEGQGFIQLVRD